MTFERLDDIVARVVSRSIGLGETGVDAPSQPGKRAASAKPAAKLNEAPTGKNVRAKSRDPKAHASKAHTRPALPKVSRRGPTPKESVPPLCVGPRLVIIEGGRTTGGRRLGRPTYRSSPEGRARELGLVVWSGGHAAPPSV